MLFVRHIGFALGLALLALHSGGAMSTVLAGGSRPLSEGSTLTELKTIGAAQSRFLSAPEASSEDSLVVADLAGFHTRVEPILKATCLQCHGPEKKKGGFRVDQLDPDLLEGSDAEWWGEVLGVVTNGDMPPPEEVEMIDGDRAVLIDWLSHELQKASVSRRAAASHSAFRRLTRYEYGYALQDLLRVPWDFARDLAPEARSEDGFVNSSETLQMGAAQLESMREVARSALRRVTVFGEEPQPLYWGITMAAAAAREWPKLEKRVEEAQERFADQPEKLDEALARLDREFQRSHDQPYYRDLESGRTARASWSYGGARYAFAPAESRPEIPESVGAVAVIPPGRNRGLIVELGDRIPDEGIMRVRVRASRDEGDDTRGPWMGLEFGWRASNEGRAVVRLSRDDVQVTALPGSPEFYQWDVPLGEIYPRNSVRGTSKMGQMPNPSEYIRLVNNSVSEGTIRLDYVEVIAPVYEEWPPALHRRIFFDSEHREDEQVYGREVVAAFMRRAWGPVTDAEVDRKMALYSQLRPVCDRFEEAVVETLATVLASPRFLYLSRESEAGDELDLARRLAAFLWGSVPDHALWDLAAEGRLSEDAVLSAQVERLLADPRSQRFSKRFVEQWLNLSVLDFLNFESTYRQVDPRLKEALREEPIAFFDELLANDESVLNFLHADFTVADERLATHYGMDGVFGNRFRRTSLGADPRRGGLLTQAGILTMNSDGEDSHPLKRGIWLLETVLNDPPPPPPPAVPEIDIADPEIAKLTLKEQLEDHRDDPACYSCHAKIDPWGIAFENYDAIGRWRNDIEGKPVDAESRLFNGQMLAGVDGLKRYLLENRQDQFVEALVHKMATYALGRPLSFSDKADVQRIAAATRRDGDGLATLVRHLVTSPLFLSP